MFILSITATLFTAIALIPQVVTTYKTQNLHEMKISTQTFLVANSLTWVVFGWRTSEGSLLLAAFIALLSHLAIYFRSRAKSSILMWTLLYLPVLLSKIPLLILELLAATFILLALYEMIRELDSSVNELSIGRFILEILEESLWGAWALLSSLYLIALPTLLYIPLAIVLLSKIFIHRRKINKLGFFIKKRWVLLRKNILTVKDFSSRSYTYGCRISQALKPTPLAFIPPD